MVISEKVKSRFNHIKRNIESSYDYDKENFDNFNDSNKFIFYSSLDADSAALDALEKPKLQFNILEAFVSRQLGEFYISEPAVKVRNSDMADEMGVDNTETIKVVEGVTRHIFSEAKKEGSIYMAMQDALGGGFSVLKVWTEYCREKAFQQTIRLGKAFSPVLCGFDPMAVKMHKGDGRYCFEIFPKYKEDFEQEHPDIDISEMDFTRVQGGFNWSYDEKNRKILLIVDYYEKKKKKEKLVKLADNQEMLMKEYEKFIAEWEKSGNLAPPPAIIRERTTEITSIDRYKIIGNQIIEHDETDLCLLPLIYVDGNSRQIQMTREGAIKRIARSYAWQARDAQRLKNFAGQSLANELENVSQHTFIICNEALPNEPSYIEGWTNLQKPSTLIWNAYNENNPEQQLPEPHVMTRQQIPAEYISTFQMCDALIQAILGSYDAALGINDNELSGKAIEKGASNSNMAALPYRIGIFQAFNQAAKIFVDLIPKYYITPMTVPIIDAEGNHDFREVNKAGTPSLEYKENSLMVEVEASASFEVQKDIALKIITQMMGASEIFSQFVNSEGLDILVDNLSIHGIDQLKERAKQFMEKIKQQQAQAEQNAAQNNPNAMKMQIEQMKLSWEAQKHQMQTQIEAEKLKEEQMKLKIEEISLQNEKLKILLEAHDSAEKRQVQLDAHETEKEVHAMDAAMRLEEMTHKHAMEKMEMHHNMTKESREKE